MSVRVVVVDDQRLVRRGFELILQAEDDIDVIGEADDGSEAVSLVTRLQPDVVLMDVRMPKLDGIAATQQIMAAMDPAPRVLVLTTFDLDEYVYSALRAGASGFLLKDAPPEQLVEAIRVVAAGDALLSPSVTKRLIEDYIARPEPSRAAPELDELTEREVDVLRLIARGLSNGEIAEALFVAETTVKTHVGRVLMKLGVRDRVQAVVAAYESGLVIPGS